MTPVAIVHAASVADRLPTLLHSPGVPPLVFALAFVAGAGHAVTPGHGKSLAAAYLVGSRGKIRDAAWLGGSVAVMHTFSVLVIGLAWTFLSLADVIRMQQLTGWLQVGAGLLVMATGLWLGYRRFRAAGHGHTERDGHGHGERDGHGHGERDGHGHPQRHDRPHDHGRDHRRGTGERPGLLMLGISGGLIPSPAAFLVLVTGLFVGRAGFALLLVMTFGIGMAVVLFGVGVLAVAGGSLVVRGARSRAVLRLATHVAPVLGAAAITLSGVGITTVAAIHLTTLT